MPTRRRFWKKAFLKGASWTNTVVGAALNLATLLALLGLVLADVLPTPWLAIAAFLGMLLVLGLGEGAYQVWEETEKRLRDAKDRLDRRKERREQLEWLGERLNIASDLVLRFRVAAMGEAERIAEEAAAFDKATAAEMERRLPEFAPEYSTPVQADWQTYDTWRKSANGYIELRAARLLDIREQFRQMGD
jgi:hypothetical protein